jgi:transposase
MAPSSQKLEPPPNPGRFKQQYTAEFKEQAVKHAQAVGVGAAARELGLVEQTLRNWVKAAQAGHLAGAGAKSVTPEQMELSRLRAENARLRMHVDILKNVSRGRPAAAR